MISGASLGDHVLELGSGPGAATEELRRRAPRVTSLEYSHGFAANLAAQRLAGNGSVLQGDAATLPFAAESFSSAIAVLDFHHLRSSEQQERAFREVFRVLRPGGIFFAVEIADGWLQRAVHCRSTFVAINPRTISDHLAAAGFCNAQVDFRPGLFSFRGIRTSQA